MTDDLAATEPPHPDAAGSEISRIAGHVVARLTARGETVACAESLTGGWLTAALIDIPGASVVVRGGMVSYATDLKAAWLGVDRHLLTEHLATQPADDPR